VFWLKQPFVFEEHVVGAVGVEGWVEVDQIHLCGLHGAENGEVVAVVEGVRRIFPKRLYKDQGV
jgi:hypothetical protein